MAFYQLVRTQLLHAEIDAVWDFISLPDNLQIITPDYMGFHITSGPPPREMYEGMIISYEVRPLLGIKTAWVTEITHIKDKKFFVDEQRIGPYRMWHHEHHIEKVANGVKMTDIVTYQPPFGLLGALTNKLVIRKKLQQIFDYRRQALTQQFTSQHRAARTKPGLPS